ncbi:hypothetical protein ACLPHM_02690 [Paenalcaligenes sp. Me131]|uniref:hypothetical protein n=1 Tax=Paenalcaligenes sp. Me131 TaxID=3392636 RepID=UPI003D272F51
MSSRWINKFNEHPFQPVWKELMEQLVVLEADDKTVTTTVEELARLKKVLAFIDEVLRNCDPELTPPSVLDQSKEQAANCLAQAKAYITNKKISHLTQANTHADNLLTYVRPYMVVPEQALDAYGKAIQAFSTQVSSNIESFQKKALETQESLQLAATKAQEQQQNIEQIEVRVKEFDAYVFSGIGGNDPAKKYFEDMISEVKESHTQVLELHKSLLTAPDSTAKEISDFQEKIKSLHESMSAMSATSATVHDKLREFYLSIYGSPDSTAGQEGLKHELDTRLVQLEEYEKDQKARHETMFDTIEALLPGATSAGLASAYKTLKETFNEPIRKYTRAFYYSLGFVLLTGLALVTDSASAWPPSIEFIQPRSWEEMLRSLLTRAPFILPAIWLAIFSATRRSQYERLQQEYAHKEALSSSYESYKQQLRGLQDGAEDLQKALIEKAIDAIAYNASTTLDANHTESPPTINLPKNFSIKELWEFLEAKKDNK